MSKARVLLADDHTLVLEGIKKLLEPHFDLVGTVEDGRALLEAAKTLKPDVVLVDISMPLLNGIDAARSRITWRVKDATAICSSPSVTNGLSGSFRNKWIVTGRV